MLGLGRAAVPRRATFHTSDQIVVQIPHMQVSRHLTPNEIIDINDLKWHRQTGSAIVTDDHLASVKNPVADPASCL